MSVVFGPCSLCPKNSKPVRLYGTGVCSYHLANPTADESKSKIKKEVSEESKNEKRLKIFYETQLAQAPECCENCGGPLTKPAALSPKTFVCHILPKKHFLSVLDHPLNRWFGCYDCHKLYDSSWANAVLMPVWRICVERFAQFWKKIKPAEVKHIPAQLAEVLKNIE